MAHSREHLAINEVFMHVAVSVLAVFGVDDAQQTMTSGMYTTFFWRDESLAWNTSEFHNVKYVRLSADDVWTPALSVANSAKQDNLIRDYAQDVIVYHDGDIEARLRMYVETVCSLNLDHYPYDEQTCPVLIVTFVDMVSWQVLNTPSDGQQLADSLRMDSEWEIINTSVNVFQILKSEEDESLQIMITLRRKRTFYTVCLVLPMALTPYMNTLVFLLPLQAGEKVSFLVSIYVSTSVYISFFTTVMPRGLDSVPNTMKLLIGVIVESLLVLLATIFVLRRSYHQQQNSNQQAVSDLMPSPPKRKRLIFKKSSSVQVEGHVDDSTEMAVKAGTEKKNSNKMRAEKLDHVFFFVFFFAVTLFLVMLLFIH